MALGNLEVLWMLALPLCGIAVAFIASGPNPPARGERSAPIVWLTGLTRPTARTRRGPVNADPSVRARRNAQGESRLTPRRGHDGGPARKPCRRPRV